MATQFDFNLSPFEFSNNFQPTNPFLDEVPVFEQSNFNQSFEPSFGAFKTFNQPILENEKSFEFENKVLDFASGVTDLLGKFKESNVRNNLQPIISSVNEPGLEPFNRFNPTLNQFETLYGNEAARLGSQDTFIPNVTGFDDEPRFLQSVRDQAQLNADNFMGVPTAQQIQQANELGQAMGTGDVTLVERFEDDGIGTGQGVLYGTEFEPRTAEELNQLLGMQQMQQIQANQNFVNSPYFQEAMAERDAPLIESRQAFDDASRMRTTALENRIPFNATFNYDAAGNKVLAGESAREAALQGGEGEMSYDEARKFVARQRDYRGNLEPMSTYNQRVEAFRAQENEKRARVNEVVANTQQFLSQNGINLETSAIRAGILSTGSAEAFIRSYARIQNDLSPSELSDYNASLEANPIVGGMPTERQGTFVSKKDGRTRTLAFAQEGEFAGTLGEVTPDGKWVAVDQNEWRALADSEITSASESALKTLNEAFDSYNGIGQMKQFKKDRLESAKGFDLFVTQMKSNFKKFFGKELNEKEYSTALAQAGFQALLGVVRLDILGPGVLTEQDARRLIEAMGGFGVTSSKRVAIELIDRLIERRQRKTEGQLFIYNLRRESNDILQNRFPEVNINNIENVRSGFSAEQPVNPNTGKPAFDPKKAIKNP